MVEGNDGRVSLHAMAAAVAVDDLDRAIDAGLLHWNGCIACAIATGLSPQDAKQLRVARESRLSALAARERHRARQRRLQQRDAQRDTRRGVASIGTPLSPALPSAAAAALARAKAKAAARAKP